MTTDRGLQRSTLNRSSGPYVCLPTPEALIEKWKRGRDKYGPVFIGHPLEELDEELLDALNYVTEAERQGWKLPGFLDTLRLLREGVCAVYRTTPVRPEKGVAMATEVEPQPAPVPNSGVPVWDLVMSDMRDRKEFGRKKYGTCLQTFNGRDALVDLYQELLDACVYVRQKIEESKAAVPPEAAKEIARRWSETHYARHDHCYSGIDVLRWLEGLGSNP